MKTEFSIVESKNFFDIRITLNKLVFKTTRVFKNIEKAKRMLAELKSNVMDDLFIHFDNDKEEDDVKDKWYFIIYDKNDIIFGMSKFFDTKEKAENLLKSIRENC